MSRTHADSILDRPDLVLLGERLRTVRNSNGWSLEDAVRTTEVKASVMGAYERGERNIPIERLIHVAQVYGTTASEMLDFGKKPDRRRIPDRRSSAAGGRREDER